MIKQHFPACCPLYSEEWNIFYVKVGKRFNNFIESCDNDKLIIPMTQSAEQTSKFICQTYDKRRSKLHK